MILRFTGGGYWDGVEIRVAHAPEEIRLSGVFLHDQHEQDNVPAAYRETVLMNKSELQRYERDRFEGTDDEEDIAIYVFRG